MPAVTPPALVLDDTKQSDRLLSLGREGGKTSTFLTSFPAPMHSATDSYKEVFAQDRNKRIRTLTTRSVRLESSGVWDRFVIKLVNKTTRS